MSRACSQRWPNMTGKLSRSATRTRLRVSSTDQSGRSNAIKAALRAAVIPAHPSTSVLSQSYNSTEGRAPLRTAHPLLRRSARFPLAGPGGHRLGGRAFQPVERAGIGANPQPAVEREVVGVVV